MKQAAFNYNHYFFNTPFLTNEADVKSTSRRLVSLISLWFHRSRTRRELAGLDARQLDDVNISHAEAQREIGKPFWLK
jgi:uncharacterized protein YjiS (DUF1127 family)